MIGVYIVRSYDSVIMLWDAWSTSFRLVLPSIISVSSFLYCSIVFISGLTSSWILVCMLGFTVVQVSKRTSISSVEGEINCGFSGGLWIFRSKSSIVEASVRASGRSRNRELIAVVPEYRIIWSPESFATMTSLPIPLIWWYPTDIVRRGHEAMLRYSSILIRKSHRWVAYLESRLESGLEVLSFYTGFPPKVVRRRFSGGVVVAGWTTFFQVGGSISPEVTFVVYFLVSYLGMSV